MRRTGHVVYTILPIVYDISIKKQYQARAPNGDINHCLPNGNYRKSVSVAVVSLTAFILNANTPLAGFDGYVDLLKIPDTINISWRFSSWNIFYV